MRTIVHIFGGKAAPYGYDFVGFAGIRIEHVLKDRVGGAGNFRRNDCDMRVLHWGDNPQGATIVLRTKKQGAECRALYERYGSSSRNTSTALRRTAPVCPVSQARADCRVRDTAPTDRTSGSPGKHAARPRFLQPVSPLRSSRVDVAE